MHDGLWSRTSALSSSLAGSVYTIAKFEKSGLEAVNEGASSGSRGAEPGRGDRRARKKEERALRRAKTEWLPRPPVAPRFGRAGMRCVARTAAPAKALRRRAGSRRFWSDSQARRFAARARTAKKPAGTGLAGTAPSRPRHHRAGRNAEGPTAILRC